MCPAARKAPIALLDAHSASTRAWLQTRLASVGLAAIMLAALTSTARGEVEARFRVTGDGHVIGAPILVQFTLKNLSDEEISLIIDYSPGRTFRFDAFDAKGMPVRDRRRADYRDRTGTLVTRVKGRATFVDTIILDRYLRITTPGSYTLVCEYDASAAVRARERPREVHHRQELEIVVEPFDREKASAKARAQASRLDDASSQVRKDAARVLSYFDPGVALPYLKKILADDERYVRAEALRGLARLPESCVVQAAGRTSQAEDRTRRDVAESVLPYLEKALADDDGYVRIAAVQGLGGIAESCPDVAETVLPHLEKSFGDTDDFVRRTALWELARLGGRGAVQVIRRITQREDPEARSLAVKVLAVLGMALEGSADADAIGFLATELKNEDKALRLSALRALARIGGDEASTHIQQLSDDTEPDVRRTVRHILRLKSLEAQHGQEDVIPGLVELFASGDPYVCSAAARWLAEIGPEAVPALVGALGNENRAVRVWATRTLPRFGSLAVPALIEQLEHDDWRVRGNALIALRRMGPEAQPAIPAIGKLLDDPNEEARGKAAEALKAIPSQKVVGVTRERPLAAYGPNKRPASDIVVRTREEETPLVHPGTGTRRAYLASWCVGAAVLGAAGVWLLVRRKKSRSGADA